MNTQKTNYYITFTVVMFMLLTAVLYITVLVTMFPPVLTTGPLQRFMLSTPALGLISLALYIMCRKM
jgi:hypothetical protein